MVGAAGFEPAISCSQSKRDTRLRYAPILRKGSIEPYSLFKEAGSPYSDILANPFRMKFWWAVRVPTPLPFPYEGTAPAAELPAQKDQPCTDMLSYRVHQFKDPTG
jgi:hypothetical protein